MRYTEPRRYNISWRRPNGTSLPRLKRTLTSCTLTHHAFVSPNNCFSIGLDHGGKHRGCPHDLSRGGGYECDEYIHASLHCMALYMYSLLIPTRAFPSEGRTTWVRRYCNLARVLMRNVLPGYHYLPVRTSRLVF
jgi:hypothetical protein